MSQVDAIQTIAERTIEIESCEYCRVIEAMTGVVNCPIHEATEVENA